MQQRFSGKTVLITGGNSGIGFATASRIVREGGKVIITGRDTMTLQQAQQDLGSNAEAIQTDHSNLTEIDRLMSGIKQKYGKINGLFANAGVAKFALVEDILEADFDNLFNINVKGVYFTMQKAMPLLSDGSSVVVNASIAGILGGETSSVYAATKAAVRSMARAFLSAYVSRGIRFNAVSPGPIETPIWNRGGIPLEAVEGTKKAITELNPMKRCGTLDEVCAVVTFLLSSESTYMLGAEIVVDGGMTQL